MAPALPGALTVPRNAQVSIITVAPAVAHNAAGTLVAALVICRFNINRLGNIAVGNIYASAVGVA